MTCPNLPLGTCHAPHCDCHTDQSIRMAQHWEAHNRPRIRRDRGEALLDALKPALWLLVVVFLALVVAKAWANVEAASAVTGWAC
ncbi:MAG: hypothetical protein JXQ79_03220 [Rhodobacteraceae bacterium]|nr:hypothetical protein [Paracoccaceae bacterium]